MPFIYDKKYFESEWALSGKTGFRLLALGGFFLGLAIVQQHSILNQNPIIAFCFSFIVAGIFYYGFPLFKKKYFDEIAVDFSGDSEMHIDRPLHGKVVLVPTIPLSNANMTVALRGFLSRGQRHDGVLEIFNEEKIFKDITLSPHEKREFLTTFTISKKEFEKWRNNWVEKSPLGGKQGVLGMFGEGYTNTKYAYVFEIQVKIKDKKWRLPEAFRVKFIPHQ